MTARQALVAQRPLRRRHRRVALRTHVALPRGPAIPRGPYYGTDARASQLLVGALLATPALSLEAGRSGGSDRAPVALPVAAARCHRLRVRCDRRSRRDALPRWIPRVRGVHCARHRGGRPTDAESVARRAVVAPVRWVGQVSYGVYLWHWPIAVALNPVRTGLDGWELAVLRTGATFAIATLSFYLVELPIRQRRFVHVWTPRVALPAAAALTIVVMLIATAGATAAEPPRRPTRDRPLQRPAVGSNSDYAGHRRAHPAHAASRRFGGVHAHRHPADGVAQRAASISATSPGWGAG